MTTPTPERDDATPATLGDVRQLRRDLLVTVDSLRRALDDLESKSDRAHRELGDRITRLDENVTRHVRALEAAVKSAGRMTR